MEWAWCFEEVGILGYLVGRGQSGSNDFQALLRCGLPFSTQHVSKQILGSCPDHFKSPARFSNSACLRSIANGLVYWRVLWHLTYDFLSKQTEREGSKWFSKLGQVQWASQGRAVNVELHSLALCSWKSHYVSQASFLGAAPPTTTINIICLGKGPQSKCLWKLAHHVGLPLGFLKGASSWACWADTLGGVHSARAPRPISPPGGKPCSQRLQPSLCGEGSGEGEVARAQKQRKN